jgi:hypothetical protein
MPKSKKPDAPKFEPVCIADCRPEVRSLATSDAESAKMFSEDVARIAAQSTLASIERLKVLQRHLGLSGELSEVNLLALLIAIANKYVPGFKVAVGPATAKQGPQKSAERFKIVTMVEARAAAERLSVKDAIRNLAAKPVGGRRLSPDSLSTKYYGALREIEGHPQGAALLHLWRRGLPNDLSADMDALFWSFENQHLKAVRPHNVHQFPLKK